MGILVSNGEAIAFGTFAAAQSITAFRFRRASDDGQPVLRRFATAVSVGIGEEAQFAIGALDIKYNSGDLTDAHMQALVEGYWGASGSRTSMEIDLMEGGSGSETVCDDTNYSQQSSSNWTVATEADDSA